MGKKSRVMEALALEPATKNKSKLTKENVGGEKIMRKFIFKASAAAMAAGAIMALQPANAALSFSLNQGNSALSGNAAPYGTVTITRVDNNTATVTLSALGLYSFGDGGTLGLNLAGGGTFTFDNVSGTTINGGTFDAGDYSSDGAGNEDGFGDFNFRVKTFDGFNHSATSLTFTLHNTSGAWTTEAAILEQNANGNNVAGHVFVRNADGSNPEITGFATVPEPTTVLASVLLLLPFGVSTLRFIRKNRTA